MARRWTNEEVEEYRKAHGSFFYFNKDDSNVFITKAYGIGWTLNWANPISWAFIILIICFVIYRRY
jgi:Predicted membrane protein